MKDFHPDTEELAALLSSCKEWCSLSALLLREIADNPMYTGTKSAKSRDNLKSLENISNEPSLSTVGVPNVEAPSGDEEDESDHDEDNREFVTLGLDGALTTRVIPSYNQLKQQFPPSNSLTKVTEVPSSAMHVSCILYAYSAVFI